MTNTNNTPNNFNIRINDSKRTIEITKTFSKLASIYGSEAYNTLKGAKADNPTYRVIVKNPPKRKIEDRISPYILLFEIKDNPNISIDLSNVCPYIEMGYYELIYDSTQDIRGCDALNLD
jgi:hypothetical protein